MNKYGDILVVAPATYAIYRKEYLKLHKPLVFLLHSAVWKAGYTVNGVRP